MGPVEERADELRNDGRAFAIEVDGELAGWIGYEEELDPNFRHASLDIFLRPDFQGRGHGAAALRQAARWLIDERGHHRITIDPAADNERAIHVYRSIGFRDAGVMRRRPLGGPPAHGPSCRRAVLSRSRDPSHPSSTPKKTVITI